MKWLKSLWYQELLIWVLRVEWHHFQFQEIKQQGRTWMGEKKWLYDSIQKVWIKNAKHVLVVLNGEEKDVIIFISQKTSNIRFGLLFGLYRKVRDFFGIKIIADSIFETFLIVLESVMVGVKGFIRKMDVNIVYDMFCDVFVKEALIVEFRNIKKWILDTFLIFFDRLRISNGLVWVLKWTPLEKMKMSRCHWKVLEWMIENVVVSGTTNLGIASWMVSFQFSTNQAS